MSSVSIQGNASGTGIFTIASPNSNTNRTLTLPDATGTIITTAGGAAISGTTGAFTTTVGVGGATPAASGAGITFPATASASSDANTLDDYEEGTWTPAIIGSTSQSGQVYSSQVGTYTKIGRQVTARFYLQLSTEGTFSGFYLLISGLPFTIAATPGNVMGGGVYFVDMATNYIAINLQCEESGARLYLLGVTAAATSRAYVGITDLTNTTQFSGTVTYFT
jgi:hypothetical protein